MSVSVKFGSKTKMVSGSNFDDIIAACRKKFKLGEQELLLRWGHTDIDDEDDWEDVINLINADIERQGASVFWAGNAFALSIADSSAAIEEGTHASTAASSSAAPAAPSSSIKPEAVGTPTAVKLPIKEDIVTSERKAKKEVADGEMSGQKKRESLAAPSPSPSPIGSPGGLNQMSTIEIIGLLAGEWSSSADEKVEVSADRVFFDGALHDCKIKITTKGIKFEKWALDQKASNESAVVWAQGKQIITWTRTGSAAAAPSAGLKRAIDEEASSAAASKKVKTEKEEDPYLRKLLEKKV